MDGAEFHGKWPFGGSPPHMPAFTFQDYLEEVPLVEHKSKQTWRQKLSDLRATTKALGRPDFLLMNNEYGLGKASAFAGNWSRFDKGLVAVELALEMYQSGYDIACFWDNGDGVVSAIRAGLRNNDCTKRVSLLTAATCVRVCNRRESTTLMVGHRPTTGICCSRLWRRIG